jgi:hypothetical protein
MLGTGISSAEKLWVPISKLRVRANFIIRERLVEFIMGEKIELRLFDNKLRIKLL